MRDEIPSPQAPRDEIRDEIPAAHAPRDELRDKTPSRPLDKVVVDTLEGKIRCLRAPADRDA
jgi:hypothetical protein